MAEINAQTGEPQSASGWSQDDPANAAPGGAGASALAPQSPLATAATKYTGRLDELAEDEKKEFAAGEAAQAPYRDKLLKMLDSPQAANAHLEKVKEQPKPEDYQKYSMEFASAFAVLGALAGKFTRAGGTAALNAFSGALKGWQAGNLQAYETASKEWEQAAKKTLENNNIEMEKYKEIMADKKANIDQMMAAMNIVAAEHQNKLMFDATLEKNYTMAFSAVDKMTNAQAKAQGAVDKLTGLRGDQAAVVKSKIDQLNSNPEMLARLPDKDYLQLKGAADALGLKLNDKPAAGSSIQSAVDEVGTYKANPQTVLSRMPPQDRTAFWNQLQAKYPDWSQQNYNAQNVGGTAGARTEATRAANLDIILNSAKAAIPQAIAASDAVPRGQWVSVNKAIQAYQAGKSDPKLAAFAVANLQIAELWARAMNPTGVMREGDRELALHNLSTATSPEAYKTVLASVQQAMDREKGAVLTTEKERGARTNANPDAGSLDPKAGGDDGWGQVTVH
jgi:hypothetical protein